jgi:hypothetical protein
MEKVSVIYRAPKGDNKVCEWGAFTFFDGVPVEIEANDANAHMISKISKNSHFELSEMGTVNKQEPERGPASVPVEEPELEKDLEFTDYKPVAKAAQKPISKVMSEPFKPKRKYTRRAR